MANILEKAYDASKKICRTIFLGKPNLFTTSDLNRQFKQMRVELDNLQTVTGVFSDFTTERINSEGNQTSEHSAIKCHCTYIICRGMEFAPSDFTSDRKYFDIADAKNQYVILRAKKKVVTYALDDTHEISGAKFADGTSTAAANQEVYYDEKFAVVDDFRDTEVGYENICLLGYWCPIERGGTLYVDWHRNYVPFGDYTKSLMLRSAQDSDVTMDSSVSTELTDKYVYPISRAINALNNMHYTKFDLFKSKSAGNIKMSYLIKKGTLVINCPAYIDTIILSDDKGNIEWFTANFEPDDENYLINRFNDMGYGNRDNVSIAIGDSTLKGVVIPIGRLHISNVSSDYTPDVDTQHGEGTVCLHLSTSSGKVVGVRITSYLTSVFSFDKTTKLPKFGLAGAISLPHFNHARIYMESIFSVITLH